MEEQQEKQKNKQKNKLKGMKVKTLVRAGDTNATTSTKVSTIGKSCRSLRYRTRAV